VPLARALDEWKHLPNRLVARPDGVARGWFEDLQPSHGTVLLIGPEGGLTDAELEVAAERGFRAVSLGGYPLRAETAVIVLVGMVRDRLGGVAGEADAPDQRDRDDDSCR
jgi:16S rRNA U1498 N3-methylase RsmE